MRRENIRQSKGLGNIAAYLTPEKDSEIEYTISRSRFIGRVWVTESENEAVARIKETRSRHWDAAHNVYAYIIKNGAARYSDDGEPGGTAGIPVFSVFQRENIVNVCCVVTRYFGGILLGAGGLVRAYKTSAKMALDAACIREMRLWDEVVLGITYDLFERVKLLIISFEAEITDADYGTDITLTVDIHGEKTEEFAVKLCDISGGNAVFIKNCEKFK